MNFWALKWLVENVVKNYKCPECNSEINDNSIDVVWAAWNTVNIDIECSNCQSTDIGEDSAREITDKLDLLTEDFEDQSKAFKELQIHSERLLYCLTQIYQDLPSKRDWLDPTLEKEIKSYIKKTWQINLNVW